jgi:signal transduction histidine kinase
MNTRKYFLFPMVISIILLPCFLAYFLYTEFEDEKEAIKLEAKDQVINRFLARIDTMARNSKDGSTGLVSWIEGDSNPDISFKLSFSVDSLELGKKISLDKGPLSIKIDSLNQDTFITLHSEGTKLAKKNRFPEVAKKIDNREPQTIEVIRKDSKSESPFFNIRQDEVATSQVIRRILPQIVLSAFLLLSVLMAYWLVGRSLMKERQLTLLRNDFMSNMSHELKTPVSTIGVALEALSNFDAGDNPVLRKEYISISKLEVERLGLLVDKALNISLYEQGKFVFDRQNIDIKQETENVLKILRVQLDNQNVALSFNAKGSDFIINVDRTHMINVIYNLIENAVKYSDDDAEVAVEIQERNSEVVISVSDNGRGIAPEFQDKVFDKFFRVPQGNKHNVKGHGLGLSYVKEVVESLGGGISLKSGLNAGSTFIIKMPKANG